MLLLGDDARLVISASDLRTASACEFAVVRQLDVLLGRAERVEEPRDPMLDRVKALGDQHEQAELRRLSREHPGRVRHLPTPSNTPHDLAAAMTTTLETLSSGAEVVSQATVFDGGFVGRADFLELTPAGWLVSDTKLARHATVSALLQVGAYAALLLDAGAPVAPIVRLVLGDGATRDDPLGEVLPVYRSRRARLDGILADHRADEAPAAWGDERWLACGSCATCVAEVEAARDLLLVAGMRRPTRRRLHEAGVRTIDDLASSTGPVADVRAQSLDRLRAQARLQLVQEADPTGAVHHEVTDVAALSRLPAPSTGDIFFDFEGDPLWQEPGSGIWGLEYLFGMIEVDSGEERFRAFWAHDRREEKQALVSFVDHVNARLATWPDLHVYHYAPYEPAALLRMAARHGVYEDEVDDLLRRRVFVDLYAVVKAGVRISQRSYSIKKLEPLYMPAREGEVQGGAESIVVYHQFSAATNEGRTDEAASLLAEIADYNELDCVSTLRLRDWLLARCRDAGGSPAGPVDDDGASAAPVSDKRAAALALEAAVRALVDDIPPAQWSDEQRAMAMIASSVLYHAREDKPAWQEHYERLRLPVGDWRRADGVFVVDRAEVVEPWAQQSARHNPRRVLRLTGEAAGGAPRVGECHVVYAAPGPAGFEAPPMDANTVNPSKGTVLSIDEELSADGVARLVVTLSEQHTRSLGDHDDLPVALTPGGPIKTDSIDRALAEVAEEVLASGAVPVSAGTDVLLRRAPRLRGDAALPPVADAGDDRVINAIEAALLAMDDSYVAAQGPPGTGKTHVGGHVIARLAAWGWRIGVCAQSHAAVENVLSAVVRAGLDPAQVGKVAKATPDPAWTSLPKADDLAAFAAQHDQVGRGYVIGGSAWDLTNERRVARDQLDLLVIDEAGQFSVAKTLAVGVCARRLLLLGDPQQLPQVSTGVHAQPVDESALGWLAAGEPVLPAHLGYFLETTRRMHPDLTTVVSDLAYDGALTSYEQVTAARRLDGIRPGLHVVVVDHLDNSTESLEEAEAVCSLAQTLIGRMWHDPSATDGPRAPAPGGPGAPAPGRPLTARDLIVITPYNRQADRIRAVLRGAGLEDVRVGTVDKFQGQEAPVAILSMAASSHSEVSRGMGFLLDRHRLNVGISRGQYAAYVVRSRVLTDFSPGSPDELIALGAFLRLHPRP
ncbi:TM0106 family RecB-like putative nuclease [Ornithinibacter sp.]|uniref:TM0106 family RecB-like putative nuclease n=1 Tax=Ornithinibacter sp. TaxID=2862748 RepID=UPI002BEE4778|nr:TM0106 family RecB-like putative nuclease [Ornithinibacter sp.]HRA26468.1 TM0106 family RecB-like putative nuclease [Ornithinibacter sp.]